MKAKDYAAKQAGPADKRPSRDLHLEALARVTNREIPLLVTAHRVPDLLAALRVASEFGIKIVLDGASESYLVLDEDQGRQRAGHPASDDGAGRGGDGEPQYGNGVRR